MNFLQKAYNFITGSKSSDLTGNTTPVRPIAITQDFNWQAILNRKSYWNYQDSVEIGYQKNPIVYAAIRRLSDAISSVPWIVEKKVGEEWQRVEGHPLELLLAEANPYMSGQDLFEIATQHLHLAGNALWKVTIVNGKPVELMPVAPDVISPVPSPTNFIDHYNFQIDQNKYLSIPVEEIIHFKFANPKSMIWGMSPLQAAARSIDFDTEAMEWNMYGLRNRLGLKGIFSTEAVLTEEQKNDLKAMMDEYKKAENAGKTLFSDLPLKKVAGDDKSPVEMDWIESRKFTREEISMVFGVPLILLGDMRSSTYNNLNTAQKQFWLDTVVPILAGMESTLNLALIKFYDPKSAMPGTPATLRITYDISQVPALREDYSEKVKAAQVLFQMGVPLNLINQQMNLGFDETLLPATPPVPAQIPEEPGMSEDEVKQIVIDTVANAIEEFTKRNQ